MATELIPIDAATILWAAGIVAIVIAVRNERRMQRHRRPGVSYADVTFRLDGAWKRKELFTDDAFPFQSRAAKWGMIGAVCIVLGILVRLL